MAMNKPEREVWHILVREYEPGLRAFVIATLRITEGHAPPNDLIDEVVQQTFVTAWASRKRYDQNRPFAPWLNGIARIEIETIRRSMAIERRHVAFRSPGEIEAIESAFAALLPGRGGAFDDLLAALRGCLSYLCDLDRTILDRFYLLDEPGAAIAVGLGLSHSDVRQRMRRAREQLRECITGKLAASDK